MQNAANGPRDVRLTVNRSFISPVKGELLKGCYIKLLVLLPTFLFHSAGHWGLGSFWNGTISSILNLAGMKSQLLITTSQDTDTFVFCESDVDLSVSQERCSAYQLRNNQAFVWKRTVNKVTARLTERNSVAVNTSPLFNTLIIRNHS